MARLVVLVLAMVMVYFTEALKISEFKSISDNVGVYDEWIKRDPSLASKDGSEDFGLAYGGDKVYLVSRRNGSAVHGGIVSTLVDGKWKHAQFAELERDDLQDQLFTLAGRLLMLTTGAKDGRIIFSKLFAWDDEMGNWTDLRLDIPDKDNTFQPLTRGPEKVISIEVPDQDGKVAYVVATDHAQAKTDSETSFSKLEIALDDSSKKPINSSLKFIARLKSDMAKTVLESALKDTRLYALVGKFTEALGTVDISIDYAIDLANNSKVDGIRLDSTPTIDYSVGKDRIFQAKDKLVFLGPHKPINDEHATRHVWLHDLATMKMQDADADFITLPNRVFAIDHKNMRLVAAGLKKGAYAAMISA